MSDDDELHEFDLSAWDAPPPPANLADAVIGRMTATDAAIAAAISQRTSSRRKTWLFAGASVAALAALAAGTFLVVRPTIVERATSGNVVAQHATHVDLGSTSANLEAGASLAWKRDGNRVSVVQRGNATWLVGGEDQLSIDAAPASVQATGANLRVEIAMNMTDVKLIGASAGTAAAVALLTVVVYEGHVKTQSGGQTTVVVPGTTVEVKPGEPPHEKLAVGMNNAPLVPTDPRAELVIPAGESPVVYDPDGTTNVQFVHPACAKPMVNVAGFTPSDQPFMLPAGHYTYTMSCPPLLDSPQGTIDILHDTGDISGLPVAKIAQPIDGEEWPNPIHIEGSMVTGAHVSLGGKVVLVDNGHGFSGDLPVGDARRVIALRFEYENRVMYFMRRAARQPLPKDGHAELNILAGESAIVHDPLGAVIVEIISKCPAIEVDGHIITDAMPLTIRDHLSYASACDDRIKGTIDVIKDDGTVAGKPLLTIEQPIDGQAWSDPVHVTGRTIGGARVSIAGVVVPVVDFRFAADAPAHNVRRKGVLAVRVDYDKQVHYFMRRAGTGDHTVATKTDFDFSGRTLDRAAIERTITAARAKLNACNTDSALAVKLNMQMKILASGDVESVEVNHDRTTVQVPGEERLLACVSKVLSALKFPPSVGVVSISYPLVFSAGPKQTPSVPVAKCDVDELLERGKQGASIGAHAAALVSFESAYQCKAELRTAELAFMSACNARNVAKARQWWGKLPKQPRDRLFQLCVRNGITRDALDN